MCEYLNTHGMEMKFIWPILPLSSSIERKDKPEKTTKPAKILVEALMMAIQRACRTRGCHENE
jgi:hypothetical protein